MDNIIFITKDALYRGYLPIYGNKYWKGKTPNLDALASKGTVFRNAHTGAPSTIMSFMNMFTGEFSHESEMSDYIISHLRYKGESFWTRAEAEGYECHIIMDEAWRSVFHVEERYYCYGENTTFHYLQNVRQGVGAHHIHEGFLVPDPKKTEHAQALLQEETEKILKQAKKPVFLWIHIPHVINGRTGYGTDIDAFDGILGIARRYFSDQNIFVSADHGNMNGIKGKLSYGHDVYEPEALIPLITPRIEGQEENHDLISNVDIEMIIFDRKIPHREIIYCDDAFYAQTGRKLAIYYKSFKYIYNKGPKTEELYDLAEDPDENVNLIKDYVIDKDRHNVVSPLRELVFYPHWEEIDEIRTFMRAEFKKVWKTGPWQDELKSRVKDTIHQYGFDRIRQQYRKIKNRKGNNSN